MTSDSKQVFLRSAGFGVGVTVALALLTSGIIGYKAASKRQKPWNSNAITAKFSTLTVQTVGEQLKLTLAYAMTNPHGNDYYLPDTVSGELMSVDPDNKALQKLNTATWADRNIIPAKQTVNVEFTVMFPLSEYDTTAADLEKNGDLIKFASRRLKEMDGLVFFDYTHRYLVFLPNGWKKMAEIQSSTN